MYGRNTNRGCLRGCAVIAFMLIFMGAATALIYSHIESDRAGGSSSGGIVAVGELPTNELTVPNVTGMNVEDATMELNLLGLPVEVVEEPNFAYTAGHVSAQYPTGGTEFGRPVTLTVSTTDDMYDVYSAKNVPNVRGYDVDVAVRDLEDAGFTVERTDGPEDGVAVNFTVTDVASKTGVLTAQ